MLFDFSHQLYLYKYVVREEEGKGHVFAVTCKHSIRIILFTIRIIIYGRGIRVIDLPHFGSHPHKVCRWIRRKRIIHR